MATVRSGQQVVGTTRVQIDGLHNQWSHIHIRNNDTTKTLYIGGPDVTTSNGLSLDKLATIDWEVPPNTSIYMVASADTVNVGWMRIDY